MKKVTLVAIVWALAMMGCSESGMDNSVASTTSEVSNVYELKLDETPKFSTNLSCNVDIGNQLCVINTKVDNHTYMALLGSYARDNEAYSVLDLDLDEQPFVVPDFVHIYTACVQDCDDFGNCAEAETPTPYFGSKVKIVSYSYARSTMGNGIQVGPRNTCHSVVGRTVGVVSTFAVVYNAGKWNEVVLQGSSYRNLKHDQALWVYRNYIYSQILSNAGL